jgi:hypothetical protein
VGTFAAVDAALPAGTAVYYTASSSAYRQQYIDVCGYYDMFLCTVRVHVVL